MKNNVRVFEYMVIIRAINTIYAVTVSIEKVDWDVLEKITERIWARFTAVSIAASNLWRVSPIFIYCNLKNGVLYLKRQI